MKTKKILSAFLAAVIMMLGCMPAFAADEIPEDYTPIYSAEDLDNIRNGLAGKYILMNDIDLSAYENWQPIGTVNAPFTGELNGNGYLIRNMKIDAKCSEAENYLGLFGVASDAYIKSVIVENGQITAELSEKVNISESEISVGMIAGLLIETSTEMRSSSATGKIQISKFEEISAGGLAGKVCGEYFVVNCSNYVDIEVITDNYKQNVSVAGLIGKKITGLTDVLLIANTANYGDLLVDNENCSENTNIFVGGITNFQLADDVVSDSYNRGNISVSSSKGQIVVGGIVGDSFRRIEESYNLGKINVNGDGNDKVAVLGGMMADLPGFGTPPISSQDFCIMNCYYNDVGLAPYNQEPEDENVYHKNLKALTLDEMKEQESFDKLNFEKIWKMENDAFPVIMTLPSIAVKNDVELQKGDVRKVGEGKLSYSTDETVAKVNENGEIVAASKGTATVTVEHAYNYKTEYKVTVMESETDDSTTNPEPPADNCPMSDWWIVKFVKWLVEAVIGIIKYIINFTVGVF